MWGKGKPERSGRSRIPHPQTKDYKMTKQLTMPKTSIRKKLKAGDYFAVPLENGEYGLGQIFGYG